MSTEKLRIAKIINDTTVVINGGRNVGIKEGQKFQIIGKRGTEPVTDPETGEELGTLDELKGIVVATDIYPRMSIAETPKTKNNNTNIMQQAIAHQMGSLGYLLNGTSSQEFLNVDRGQITGGLPEKNSPVQIGDYLEKIN